MLNKKGKKIMSKMKESYGKKAEQVFCASKNKGKIKEVEKPMHTKAIGEMKKRIK